MRLPRIRRISFSERVESSVSPMRTVPPTIRPSPSGSNRMMDSAVTLFPQPDSPTIPIVSPRRTSNETPSTARTTPSRVKNRALKSRTDSTMSASATAPDAAPPPEIVASDCAAMLVMARNSQPPGDARIERIAQAVADQIDGEDGEREHQAGKEDDPRRELEVRPAGGDDIAPARDLRRRPCTEE